ncbi:hypothetical protein B0H14DRAFT_3607332 [Mycena olivaceomarginata]|nr:hypothetical protein B0H14DRAFT_3660195 [Mycena olivaceomarginata]KAJ7743552.1 hypothetical protein B0H14DRAFT_3607332 [Mycena olivaceomarginata]
MPPLAHIAAGTLQIVRSALGAVRVAAHVAVPPWNLVHVLRVLHFAACLRRGVHGAEDVPQIVHKGMHNAPRPVAVHLPSVVVHGSGFVLVAVHVPRFCSMSAALPRMSHIAHVAVHTLDWLRGGRPGTYSTSHASRTNINRCADSLQFSARSNSAQRVQ